MKSDLTFRTPLTDRAMTFYEHDTNIDRLAYRQFNQWEAGKTYEANEWVNYRGISCVANRTTEAEPTITSPDWSYVAWTPQFGALTGAPATFTPGSSFTAIGNWPEVTQIGWFNDNPPNTTTGVITLPLTGKYDVILQVIFQQGNTNKELACLLEVRSSVASDFVIDAIQISDDKTDWRALGAVFGYAGTAGETLQLGLRWVNQTMGSCTFQPSTFDVRLTLPVGIEST